MIRRHLLYCLLLFASPLILSAQDQVYELRTYELQFARPADLLNGYFENALIPALNRQGVEAVGVFEESDGRLPKKLYVLIPYADIGRYQASRTLLEQDAAYLRDAEPYLQAPESSIAFSRFATELIRSSRGFPELVKPGENGLLELRTYRSKNEDALRRKVKMFDEHEFPIFADAGLEMVFFGQTLAGTQMPCLTYMLATRDRAASDAGWAAFLAHPDWKRITQIEEFKGSVNDIIRVFLTPVPYSQL